MNKELFRYTLFVVGLLLAITACENDTVITPEEQATRDDERIVSFLKSHTISSTGGAIEAKVDGQKTLYELATKDPSGVYYYIHQQGKGTQATTNSTSTIHYEGFLIPSTRVFDSSFDRGHTSNIALEKAIMGWQIGIPKFKGGVKVKNESGEESYTHIGKGFLFIPSGLAYKTQARVGIPSNSSLGFRIELYDITP